MRAACRGDENNLQRLEGKKKKKREKNANRPVTVGRKTVQDVRDITLLLLRVYNVILTAGVRNSRTHSLHTHTRCFLANPSGGVRFAACILRTYIKYYNSTIGFSARGGENRKHPVSGRRRARTVHNANTHTHVRGERRQQERIFAHPVFLGGMNVRRSEFRLCAYCVRGSLLFFGIFFTPTSWEKYGPHDDYNNIAE